MSKLNKSMIILALETLLEQLVDSRENSYDNKEKIKKVSKELIKVKNTL